MPRSTGRAIRTVNSKQIALTIDSDGLSIEGMLHLPQDATDKAPGVVVCHPHPRYGGDMNNDVVLALVSGLVEDGFAALRFNFRGVGNSEGAFDWGSGETDDADAALETLSLRDEVDGSRLGIVGYSFGAAVAIQSATDSTMSQAVAAIACPAPQFRAFSGMELLQPKLFVLGDHDHNFPVDQFRFLCKRFADPRRSEVVTGADHFFRGSEPLVAEIASEFFAQWLKR